MQEELQISSPRSSKAAMLAFRGECLRKHRDGKALTLDETAFAMWNPDTEAKPMTPMGILKIERRALAKLKEKLKESGVTSLDDLFDPKHREMGKPIDTQEH